MSAFVYWFCAIFCLTYYIAGWNKQVNKIKSCLGIVIAFIPGIHLILTIFIVVGWWPSIKAWWKRVTA